MSLGGSNRTTSEKLFDDFVEMLREKVKPTKNGEGVVVALPSAADLNVIRQFLKDQNISADEDKHGGLQDLKAGTRKMPFSEKPDDEDI